jgi:phosphoribosylglycinamide formyltransferase-1
LDGLRIGNLPAVAPIAVLISGTGSNLRRILEYQHSHDTAYEVSIVIADRPADGLQWADQYGVPSAVVPWTGDRKAFTTEVCDRIAGCDWVVLAGFMRILSAEAIDRFAGRIVNIHPSLLPSFPGAHAVEAALAAGVDRTGVTIHFVVEAVDAGPIIAQREVPILPGDTVDSLHARIQIQEHDLLPRIVDALTAGRITAET